MSGTATAPLRRTRLFFAGTAALALLVVFAGFARTYYLGGVFDGPVLRADVHGLIFSAWIIVFLAQATLVARRRIDWHRRLGLAGAALVVAMIVSGLFTAIASARSGHTPLPAIPPLAFLAVPLFDIAVFGVLAGTGLRFRRQTDAHRRFMTLATIGILSPAIARLPIEFIQTWGPLAFFGLQDLLVLACFAYDWRTARRIHWATVAGALLIVISQPLRLMVAGTDAWLAFAGWLTGTA
jgi:FtsH-binding integral membrane protein